MCEIENYYLLCHDRCDRCERYAKISFHLMFLYRSVKRLYNIFWHFNYLSTHMSILRFDIVDQNPIIYPSGLHILLLVGSVINRLMSIMLTVIKQ